MINIISYFDELNKWMLTKQCSFIGHEYSISKSIFTVIHINGKVCHIEYFYEEDFIVCNIYKDMELIYQLSTKNLHLILFEVGKK